MYSDHDDNNRQERKKPLTVTLGDPPIALNDEKLQRSIPVDESPLYLIVNVGRTGFVHSDEYEKKYFRLYNTERDRSNPEFEDQKLRFVSIQGFFNEIPENAGLNKDLARIYQTEQPFQCNAYPEITRVFVVNASMSRYASGKHPFLEDRFDSKFDLSLMDLGYTEEGANRKHYQCYRNALSGNGNADPKYKKFVLDSFAKDKETLEKNIRPERKKKSIQPVNLSKKPPEVSPALQPGTSKSGSSCCRMFGRAPGMTAAGMTGAAALAGTGGAIVYLASPAVREWADENMFSLMTAVICGKVADEAGHPIPGATATFAGTKYKQKKTAATGTGEKDQGDYQSPCLYPDTYTITITAKGFDTATTQVTAGKGRTKQDLTIKKKTPG